MAKDFRELAAWQLADELRRRVIALTAVAPAKTDWKFCTQIRDASESASSNTAEGFKRHNDGDFIRFLDIARGSLGEVQDRLDGALTRNFISSDAHRELLRLSDRAIGANVRLTQYLARSRKRRRRRGSDS